VYGGYYTQDEIRDVVRYAAQRHIEIVPEIDMPGHAQAAIAAYPELGTGEKPGVSVDWGVHTYLFNVEDSTFAFIENVLDEVVALFPGKYLHVGGDEAAKDRWQASPAVQARLRSLGLKDETALQGWFLERLETMLEKRQRKLIGWDEILESALPPEATVMSWRGTKGALEAARKGHDVVLSPAPQLYLNNLQSLADGELPARLDALVATRETGEDGTSTDAGAVAVRDARATAAAFAAEAAAARDRAATAETAAREALRARDDALRELEIDRAARSSDASDRRAAFARVVADETKAETESGTIARLREALAEVERERERDRIERAADADLRVELEHINASLVEEAMKCTEIEKKMRAEIKRARRELRDARAARDDALRLAAGAEVRSIHWFPYDRVRVVNADP